MGKDSRNFAHPTGGPLPQDAESEDAVTDTKPTPGEPTGAPFGGAPGAEAHAGNSVQADEDTPRPLIVLSLFRGLFPGLWEDLEGARSNARLTGATTPEWPGWCFMPTSVAAVTAYRGMYGVLPPDGKSFYEGLRRHPLGASVSDVAAALFGWRMAKGVYRYDKDVFRKLFETPVTGKLPTEVLYRLPEWCPYIEVPGAGIVYEGLPGKGGDARGGEEVGAMVRGFWMFLDFAGRGLPDRLYFVADAERFDESDGSMSLEFPAYALTLSGETLEECVGATARATVGIEALIKGGVPEEEVEREVASAAGVIRSAVSRLLSVGLYLCAEDAEVVAEDGSGALPANPAPKKTKKRGEKLFAAEGVKEWNVAWRLGAQIRAAEREAAEREAEAGGEGARKRPHIRRAHWHSFWTGPRDPARAHERKKAVKWLPPLAVNARESSEDMPAVVRRVGEPG